MITEFERLGFNLDSVNLWEKLFELLVEYHLTDYITPFLKKLFNVTLDDAKFNFYLKTDVERIHGAQFDMSRWTKSLIRAIRYLVPPNGS
jgi:hypothetical protein